MTCTILDVYSDYLEYLKLKNKITTIRNIDYIFNKHIIPYFKDKPINKIEKNDYIKFQTHLATFNFSNRFYKNIHTLCNGFFKYLHLMYGVENIIEQVGFINPYKIEDNNNINVWTKKEFKKFIKQVDEPIYHAFFTLLFYTGLRKGEALALKINNLHENTISVNATLTKETFNGKRLLLPPKSKSSIRTIHVDYFLKRELNHLIRYYTKHFKNYNTDFYLFGGDKPLSTTTIDRKKNYYCKKAKVKQIRIHDFRHSHATMLYNKNVKIKTIQDRLGHQDISTTLNTYVHIDRHEKKRLIKTINLLRV